MRYDKPFYFVRHIGKTYDADLGEWVQGTSERIKKFANITPMGAERQRVIFGDVSNERLVVRLQRIYLKPYDLLEINGKIYQGDKTHTSSDSLSLVVIEHG
ncbi:hypothetical protein RyT2_14950 [Pseudolactococcus yaeyamensis]